MTREKAGALFFLLLSMGYGALAFQIPLIFLSQGETFNARSMPYGIAIAGMVFSLLILILPPAAGKKSQTARQALSGLDWRRAAYLILSMVIYSLAIPGGTQHQAHFALIHTVGYRALAAFKQNSGDVHRSG